MKTEKINVNPIYLPTFGYNADGARPEVIAGMSGYFYKVVERGIIFSRKWTSDLNELLYWVFSDITHTMAVSYECQHRIYTQDSRRIIFDKQFELLNIINPDFKVKRMSEISDLINKHPFHDAKI